MYPIDSPITIPLPIDAAKAGTTMNTIPQLERRLGDTKCVAALLNVSEKTIRRMTDAGKLPGVLRIGRLLRYDLKILDLWITQEGPPLHQFKRRGGQNC
jgi:excisionase family DNA binding protein